MPGQGVKTSRVFCRRDDNFPVNWLHVVGYEQKNIIEPDQLCVSMPEHDVGGGE